MQIILTSKSEDIISTGAKALVNASFPNSFDNILDVRVTSCAFNQSNIHTGWVKKNWDLKKFQIAQTHSILKLKSIVIPLNQMSQSGEKHAQD